MTWGCEPISYRGDTRDCQAQAPDDEALLAAFVIWGLRLADLPKDVQQAAARLACAGQHPSPIPLPAKYLERSFRVSGFPADDDEPVLEERAHVWELGRVVQEMWDKQGVRYVLVDDRR